MIKTFIKNLFLAIVLLSLTTGVALAEEKVDISFDERGQTPIYAQDTLFNAAIVELNHEAHEFEFSTRSGLWERVDIHDDGFGADRLLLFAPTRDIQFRVHEHDAHGLKGKVTLLPYRPEDFRRRIEDLETANTLIAKSFDITPRREWGADESLRIWNPERSGDSSGSDKDPCAEIEKKYGHEVGITSVAEYTNDGQPLTWPIQTMSEVKKFIVHHTDSEIRDLNGDHLTDTRDYRAIVRAIYHYHAISRGWGDIGYNYIIDPLGNIYEGRYGGDKTIGAHALCFNNGTMGIAVIGDYQDKEISEPAMQALTWLIGSKAGKYKIDPRAKSSFHGKDLFNVLGHKDVRATSCPGEKLYSQLPDIRDRASLVARTSSLNESNLAISDLDYNAVLTSGLETETLNPGEQKTLYLKYKNTGQKTWDNNTWMHVSLNNDPHARVVPIVADKSFVAANLKETSVKPGQTGTFQVQIEGGYRAGHYAFQVAPVVNGRFRISRASEFVTFTVEKPVYDYEVVEHEFPRGTVFQEQRITATVELRNTGNVTWRNYGKNQIKLGTIEPRDRHSIFIEDNPSRIGYMIDSEVAPGQTGEFVMDLEVPKSELGEVIERFAPVIENVTWLKDKALGFRVAIREPKHLAKTTKINRIGDMIPGEKIYVEADIKNLGDLPWSAETVSTTLLGRGINVFAFRLYPQKKIKPGETQRLGFWAQAPYKEGHHSIYLRSRFNNRPIRGAVARYIVYVPKPLLRAVRTDQSDPVITVERNKETELWVKFKNTGNSVWHKKGDQAVHLGTAFPKDRTSDLYSEDTWIAPQRAAELIEEEVRPGEYGTFRVIIKPTRYGTFTENFQVVMEHVGWVTNANVRWTIKVVRDAPSLEKNESGSISEDQTNGAPIGALIGAPVKEDQIRILLSHNSDNATLTANSPFLVFNEKDQVILNLSEGKQVTVKKLANAFQVTAGTQTKNASVVRLVPKEAHGIVEVLSMERRPAWNPDINDNRFRGAIEMRQDDGQVVYINELPLEDYVKGLGEVSNSAPTEKQKVIAILARTYAQFYMSDENRKFPGKPWDGSDDPDVFQKYLGYGLELRSPNYVKAAKETAGQVVTYKGELVKTPYFNQSDGRTRSAEEVWGWTHTPYLQSVNDPWCEGLELLGHGVGLSGCGATAQAEEGKNYKEIIKYYYSGVEVD
jgi:hypothetical protein